MFPIVRSLCSAFGSEPGDSSRKIGAYLIQTEFQGDCITSAMFLTSVAPNTLVAVLALQTAGVNISWGTWALAAVLPGLIALAVVPYLLYRIYPPEIHKTPEAKEIARKELEKMGPMSRGQKIVSGVFVLALTLWATSGLTNIDATVVAMIGVGIMLIGHAIEWKDVIAEKGAWDTLIWMGGLISLASALTEYGVIGWFADKVASSLVGIPWMIALGILLLAYMYSHYAFASLSAHVTAMYAAFLAVAVGVGAPPFLAAMSLGVNFRPVWRSYPLCNRPGANLFWSGLHSSGNLVDARFYHIRCQPDHIHRHRWVLVEGRRSLVIHEAKDSTFRPDFRSS